MTTTLLIIDIQNDYFPGGAYPLVEPDAAATAARRVLDRFRESGLPVIHVRHLWDETDAPFLKKGTPGADIHELVAPHDGEPVVEKEHPNAFRETTLQDALRRHDAGHLVVVGMMTSMCVDSTVRAAIDLGLEVTLVADACAAPDLEYGGTTVPGASVHAAFVAAMGDAGAQLTTSGGSLPL